MYATLTLPAGQDFAAPRRSTTVRVRSANELQTALRHARQHQVTLDGGGMDRVLRMDTARGLLEVQAATTWKELTRYLAAHKIALDAFEGLARMPAMVGEAIAQASAGPDGLPVTAHVAAVALVTPDGELRRADRGNNSELLRLVLGGQAVIGVLYSVTLSIESLLRSAAQTAAAVELRMPEAGFAGAAACAIECLLPPEALDGYLNEVRWLLEERRLALLGISVRRYLPDGSCHLNWATREWAGVDVRFGTKSTLGACVVATEMRRALLAAALARGGSFPVASLRDATHRQLETCYPMLKGFLAEKRRADPAERLQSAWYRQASATLRMETCPVRWSRS